MKSLEINPYVHVLHVCAYMCIHVTTCVSFEINPYVHVLYVLAYMCIHVYTCIHMQATYRPHIPLCVSVPTTGPKHPRGGPATSGPHSGRPWAAALPLYPEIRDPPPDPFWRTCARCTRRGGANAAPLCSPWALHAQRLHIDPILSPVRADLGRWRCA